MELTSARRVFVGRLKVRCYVIILSILTLYQAWGQVNPPIVQRIETSQVLTSTVPIKLLFDSAGTLYMAGQSVGGCLVVGRYATNGSEIWKKTYCGSESPSDRPAAIALDPVGNFYVAAIS